MSSFFLVVNLRFLPLAKIMRYCFLPIEGNVQPAHQLRLSSTNKLNTVDTILEQYVNIDLEN